MSSAGYATPLRIDLRPSRRLAGAIVFAYGGALLMILLVPVPVWVAIPAAAAIAGAGWLNFAERVLMRRDRAVVSVLWSGDGQWELLTRDGGRQPVRLLPDSYVHPLLTVLNFGRGARRRSVILLPDGLDPRDFRRLRARLGLAAGSAGVS